MSLANSKLPAIIITDKVAPANSLDKPNTEKKAALPATNNADNPTSFGNILKFSSTKFSLLRYVVITIV